MKPINLQITVTLDEDTLTDLIRRAVISAMGIDPQREARVRASQHANFGGQKPPEDKGLLIDTRQAAKLLKISARTIFQMEKDGRMPAAIRIGDRAVRWSYMELQEWVNAGCPERKDWKWPK
jgi:excisionase family DNA binding protein